MSEYETTLWEIVSRLRDGRGHVSFEDAVRATREGGREVTYNHLWHIGARYPNTGYYAPAPFVVDFMATYCSQLNPRSILDPWAGGGAVLVPVVEKCRPDIAIGLERSLNAVALASLMSEGQGIGWEACDPLESIQGLAGPFDAVVSCPPIGYRPRSLQLHDGKADVDLHTNAEHLLLLQAALLLSASGAGIFVTDCSFLHLNRSKHVLSNLNRFGLYLDAALSLPPGTLSQTSIPGLLVIIRRQRAEQLFVGELSAEVDADVLLSNLLERKQGPVPELGRLTTLAEFSSFQQLKAQEELKTFASEQHLSPIALREVATEINLARRSAAEPFEERPNTVYLPLLGTSSPCLSLQGLKIKPQNYAQIVLDPEKADARWLASFYDSPIGRTLLQASMQATAIPRLTLDGLRRATIFAPDLDRQRQLAQVEGEIELLMVQLEKHRRDLREHPLRASSIARAVGMMQPTDSLESWLETLPSPLATVLWTYHAADSPKEKSEHLQHFFEALAELNATLMLSGFASDKTFLDLHKDQWVETDSSYKGWFRTAAFGNWLMTAKRLAKTLRQCLSQSDERDRCLRCFGDPPPGFLEMLSDKRLYNQILETARDIRNRMSGHTGIRSERWDREQLRLLDQELLQARSIISDWYARSPLYRPGSAIKSEGMFDQQAHVLMGPRYPFRTTRVRVAAMMETESLYALPEDGLRPVELLPFVWLGPTDPEERSAFYFYSRLEDGSARYVSYHYQNQPEQRLPAAKLKRAFDLLAGGRTEG